MKLRVTAPTELATDRLRLRQWRPTDRAPFARLNSDPQVMQYFPAPLSREESDRLADRCERDIDRNGWGLWSAELNESGEFIGFVGLNVPAHELPFGPCVEIGWRLWLAHWGRGLASEAAQACLGFGFVHLELEEIVSFTELENQRSRRVMERIGMRDTERDFDHPGVPEGSPLRRHCLYALSRIEWARARAGSRDDESREGESYDGES